MVVWQNTWIQHILKKIQWQVALSNFQARRAALSVTIHSIHSDTIFSKYNNSHKEGGKKVLTQKETETGREERVKNLQVKRPVVMSPEPQHITIDAWIPVGKTPLLSLQRQIKGRWNEPWRTTHPYRILSSQMQPILHIHIILALLLAMVIWYYNGTMACGNTK